MSESDGFEFASFYRALDATREARGLNWKQVASEAKVNASTLARMAQDRRPDAAGLAALAAWSGINPGEFVSHRPMSETEPLAEISKVLSRDRNLDPGAAVALEEIVRAAYGRLAKKDGGGNTG